jgi:uncharacterized membrane protein YozB (DUF420 family)
MTAASLTRAGLPAERRFFLGMMLAIWAIVLAGFAQSFFLRPFFPKVLAAPEPIFYIHGALFLTWFLLLAVQTSLISTGDTAAHRRLGLAGFVLVPLMLAMGLYAATVAARRPTGFTGVADAPMHFYGVLVIWMLMFVTFAGLALLWRRKPQIHKRLMLLATFNLAEAAVTRFPVPPINTAATEIVAFWATAPLLIPLVVWDLTTLKRLHPATLWGGLAFLVYGPLREAAAATPAWHALGKWGMSLLG